jgi:aminoglycoside phosphotransferase (APT) family kinase protein
MRYSRAEIRDRREAARDAARRWVEARLLPSLGAFGPARLTFPEGGRESLVYFADAPGAPPLVVRADRSRRKLARRAANHALLEAAGFPVPAILARDLGLATRLRFGLRFLAERRMAGVPLERHAGTAAIAAPLGRLLARLHGHRAPWRPWRGGGRRLRRDVRRWLARYRAAGGPRAEEIERWFDRRPRADWAHEPRLCLGDIAAENILTDGERIALVDLSLVGYAPAALELARARRLVFHHDGARFAPFFEAYLAAAEPALRREVVRTFPVLCAAYQLKLAGQPCAPEAREKRIRRLFETLDF